MDQTGPEPIAVTLDGQPIFPAVQVPPGSPQPLGVLPNGEPVWPAPPGTVAAGTPLPYGVTSDGSAVWARPAAPLTSKPTWQKKRVLIPAGALALFVFAGVAGGGGDNGTTDVRAVAGSSDARDEDEAPVDPAKAAADKAAADKAAADKAAADKAAADKAAADKAAADKAAADKAAADKAAADKAAKEKAAEAAKGTRSQQNAYDTAVDFLDFSAFSRAGLIQQLSSEHGSQFPVADAEFAVTRLEREGQVDWNAEAAEAAKDYLDFSSFSRQGLLDQLSSKHGAQFTPAQAEYGVSQAGL